MTNQVRMHVELTELPVQLAEQPPVRLEVRGRVVELGPTFAAEHDAIPRVGQVFGREPEVDRVAGDVVERETGDEQRGTRLQDFAVGLAEHLDVPEWEGEVVCAPVVVVDAEGLLEPCRVGLFGDGYHGRVDVCHVVAADAGVGGGGGGGGGCGAGAVGAGAERGGKRGGGGRAGRGGNDFFSFPEILLPA